MVRLWVFPSAMLCLLGVAHGAAVATELQPVVEEAGLNLTPPQAPLSFYRNDPPGTFYGDTSGIPGGSTAGIEAPSAEQRSRCARDANGEPKAISGGVSTGIGYSSRLGSSRWNAAHVDYCNEYETAKGGQGRVQLHLGVGNYDGPGYGPGGYGYDGDGPLRPGAGVYGPGWLDAGTGPRPLAPSHRPSRGGRR